MAAPGSGLKGCKQLKPGHFLHVKKNSIKEIKYFYTSIFTIAEFRTVKSFKELYNFQAKHKLLFMTYNQTKMRLIGKIAANEDSKSLSETLENYYLNMLEIFSKRPRYLSNINTHMHAFGYYKNNLTKNEKVNF